jgi:hypothetical protein
MDHQDGIRPPPSIGEIVLGAINPDRWCDLGKMATLDRFGQIIRARLKQFQVLRSWHPFHIGVWRCIKKPLLFLGLP